MENLGGMILTGGKLMINPPELSGHPTSSHLSSNAGGTGKRNDEFCLKEYLFLSYFEGFFNVP
jgi:hypothetical protein